MLFLLQHYFYSESDIKEPQPSPPAPSLLLALTSHKERSIPFTVSCIAGASKFLHSYHFLSLNMNYFNPPTINSLLDENKKG